MDAAARACFAAARLVRGAKLSAPLPATPAQTNRASAGRSAKSPPVSRLGALPEWNLADLYAGLDDPQVERDLERAAAESLAFEQAYKGKLAAIAEQADAGAVLAEAGTPHEALDYLLGRVMSYGGLLH